VAWVAEKGVESATVTGKEWGARMVRKLVQEKALAWALALAVVMALV
jgi:dolichol kinase